MYNEIQEWARSSGGERLTHIQEAAGSKPAEPTILKAYQASAFVPGLFVLLLSSLSSHGYITNVDAAGLGRESLRELEDHLREFPTETS